MSFFIKIERIPYEEPHHLELMWTVSNGSTSTCFTYYCNADDLKKIAKRLKNFPRHGFDVFLYELGSERPEDRFGHYFRFRTFLKSPTGGQAAIQLRFNNNEAPPYKEITELCMQMERSQINELGKMFSRFSKLEDDLFIWSEKDMFIGSEEEFRTHILLMKN